MESGELKRDVKLEEKITKMHRLFGLRSVGDIIRESKVHWGESTLINSPKKKEAERPAPVADIASIKQQIQLLAEDDTLNLNKRDKKQLKKKLKRKLKKIKKDCQFEEEDQSQEEPVQPETLPTLVKDVKPDPFEYAALHIGMTRTYLLGIST